MTNQSFKQGFLALSAAFQGISFNSDLLWETLKDMDGQLFLLAVSEVIKTQKELFPGSNIIAILRDKADKISDKNRISFQKETEAKRLERMRREARPMPEEVRVALGKIGIFKNDLG